MVRIWFEKKADRAFAIGTTSDNAFFIDFSRPLMLQGHERSITQIKYNREGDLLFSSSKDNRPNVWFSVNGERLGTYNGHQGAVWCLDVDWTSTKFVSGGGDMTLKLWSVETGKNIASIPANSSVRCCNFSFSGNQTAYSTDQAMGHSCELFIIDTRTMDSSIGDAHPIMRLPMVESKITSFVWFLDDTIITGHENGTIASYDLRMQKEITSVKDHTAKIEDMQMARDSTMFVTASRDSTAKLFDSDTLNCLKTYKTERPVNSAAISPILDHVVLGGGQDAMEVTTTSTRSGKFDSRFFHLVYEEEFARLKGHFGPINSLAFHPDGKSYASGGEDGFVRVQYFDPNYFDLVFE